MGVLAKVLEPLRSRPRETATTSAGEKYIAGDGWDTAAGVTWSPPPLIGKTAITHPYREAVVYRAALKALSEPFSRLPLRLWDRPPEEEGAIDISAGQPNHPLVRLWARPNALLTGADLWKLHMIGYREGGETYLFLADTDGQPLAATNKRLPIPAQVLPAFRWGVDRKGTARADGQPAFYRMTGQPSGIRDFPPESVIRIYDVDPYDWTRGFGDGQALAAVNDLTHQASRYLASFVRSGGDPGAWIKHKNKIGAPERQRLQQEANDTFSNTGGHARYRHIGGDLEIVPNPVRPRDMEYGNLFKYTQSMVLALCAVPAPIIGDLERATYNNIQIVELLMWRGPNGILSTMRRTEDALNEMFLRRVAGVNPRWVYRFDTSEVEVLQKDSAAELKQATEMASRGVGLSVVDALEALGAEAPLPADAGQERWLASNLRTAEDRAGERVAVVLGALAAQVANRDIPPEAAQRIAEITFPGTVEPGDAATMFPDPGPAPEPPPVVVVPPPGAAPAADGEGSEGEGEEGGEGLAVRGRRTAGRTASPNPSGAVYAFKPGQPIVPDPTLAGLVVEWLERYQVEQTASWAKIARAEEGKTPTPIEDLLESGPGGQIYRGDVPEGLLTKFVLAETEWARILGETATPQFERLFLDALAATQEALGGPFISATDPRVLQFFRAQQMQWTRVTQTVTDEVRDILFSALTGETGSVEAIIAAKLPQLDEGLAKVFGTNDARANAIARTETAAAQNGASYLQMQEAKVSHIGWRHSGNPNGRPDHMALDGVVVPIGQKFANGLRHPHDPANGDAGDKVNCACTFYADRFEGDQ